MKFGTLVCFIGMALAQGSDASSKDHFPVPTHFKPYCELETTLNVPCSEVGKTIFDAVYSLHIDQYDNKGNFSMYKGGAISKS